MRIYSASDQEALRARNLLKDWASQNFLTEPQYQAMEKDTVCELRTTNIFLRIALFLFTVIIVAAAAGLFFAVVFSHPSQQTIGVFLLIFAVVSYATAEGAVFQARLHRHGIEEALAVCSVGFLCAGIAAGFFSGSGFDKNAEFLIPGAGAVLSLWIWHRFGLWYAFVAAMIFAVFLPGYWTSSHSTQRLLIALFYGAGLAIVAAVRSRHRLDYLNEEYSFVEAALWLGTYLAINLQLPSFNLDGRWWTDRGAATEFSAPFYWATWVLIWCFPPAILMRGIRGKDRFVIDAGAIAALLTFISNKPYLGWPRHTWDPMLLGALLVGVALFIRRWVSRGQDGVRRGFTAERLSGKHKEWMSTATAAFSLAAPQSITPAPQTRAPHFGGGDSGGGGASGDF